MGPRRERVPRLVGCRSLGSEVGGLLWLPEMVGAPDVTQRGALWFRVAMGVNAEGGGVWLSETAQAMLRGELGGLKS